MKREHKREMQLGRYRVMTAAGEQLSRHHTLKDAAQSCIGIVEIYSYYAGWTQIAPIHVELARRGLRLATQDERGWYALTLNKGKVWVTTIAEE